MSEIFGDCERRAKYEHQCYWCGEAIKKDEQYATWVWAGGRKIERVKAHLECRAAWNEMAIKEGGYCEVSFAECERGSTRSKG